VRRGPRWTRGATAKSMRRWREGRVQVEELRLQLHRSLRRARMKASSLRRAIRRPNATSHQRLTLHVASRVRLGAALVVAGTSAALVFHMVMRFAFSHGYPYTHFLYAPVDRFQDYYNMFRAAQHFHPGDSNVMVYSPLLHLLMTAFTSMPPVIGLVVIMTAFMTTVFAVFYFFAGRRVGDKRVRILVALALSLASYPVLFALDRGNLEMVVFRSARRLRLPVLRATFCLGVAASGSRHRREVLLGHPPCDPAAR